MALTITVKKGTKVVAEVPISDAQEAALMNDMLSIEDWLVQGVINGQVYKSETLMVRKWTQKLLDDPAVTTMPADKEAIIAAALAHPDYLDRPGRDAKKAADDLAMGGG